MSDGVLIINQPTFLNWHFFGVVMVEQKSQAIQIAFAPQSEMSVANFCMLLNYSSPSNLKMCFCWFHVYGTSFFSIGPVYPFNLFPAHSLSRVCLALVLAAHPIVAASEEVPEVHLDSWGDFWLFRFLVNAAGYASILVPGFLLIQYFKRKNYLETGKKFQHTTTV